jgi:hypothetical protein
VNLVSLREPSKEGRIITEPKLGIWDVGLRIQELVERPEGQLNQNLTPGT